MAVQLTPEQELRIQAVVNAGGYLHDTVGEDMELVLRLKRLSYESGGPGQIAFVPDPVAWTEVPESAKVLGRQRDRWHRGLADVLAVTEKGKTPLPIPATSPAFASWSRE